MTALQEQTANTLADTEATLKATGEELAATQNALSDMTALQEQTANTLADTEATLKATSEELAALKQDMENAEKNSAFSAEPTAFVVDYPDEKVFEADLFKGLDLTGKTVTFTPIDYKPTSAFGYNLWAGEHLNFVSITPPSISVGETVTVRVTQIRMVLGSPIINYELVE